MPGKADIKIGYSCNNNCVHCVIADQREQCKRMGRDIDRTTDEYMKELYDSKLNGCDSVVFTGGEPTIRKDLIYLIHYAKRLGFGIGMQTNGRAFFYKEYAKKFVPYNISYTIAMHGPNKEIHEKITRSKNSFNQTYTGIKNLKELGINDICGKTVISRFNFRYLPDLAQKFFELGIEKMNFAFPHANGNAWKYFDDVVPTYSEIIEYVNKAIEIANKNNFYLEFEAIPFCFFKRPYQQC